MANKKVQNEVSNKEAKKKGRRLKRSVRKTFGALFLAAAIGVAAIPVDNLRAEDGSPESGNTSNRTQDNKVTLVPSNTKETDLKDGQYKDSIPILGNAGGGKDEDVVIYSTGDGLFQFAYFTDGATDAAMILQFNKNGNLDGNRLEIPDAVEAYAKYSAETSQGIYVAVDNLGSFLFYQVLEPQFDESGNPIYEVDNTAEDRIKRDEYGNPIQAKEAVYYPCYYSTRNVWGNFSSDKFYIISEEANSTAEPGASSAPDKKNYVSIGDGSGRHRISNALVYYIGNQTIKEKDDKSGWEIGDIITTSNQGIFAGASNIRYLVVGKNLSAIGNYAFYGCRALQSISFGNGMKTIGNYAFANCNLLEEVTFSPYTSFDILGEKAFYNCQNLGTFMLPNATSKVGDCAFEDCYNLQSINMDESGTGSTGLEIMGYDVFKGCENLKSITFPRTYKETVDITMFQRCFKLEYIETQANEFNLKDGDDSSFTFKEFKEMVPSTFYLKGMYDRDLHHTATDNEIAYSYFDSSLGRDVYELTVTVDGKKSVYRVTSDNELVYSDIDKTMETIELPASIGPYGISTIDEYAFQGRCTIKKIVIPGTVTKIEKNSFLGCHGLENVVWSDPNPNLVIEDGAFKTQDISRNISDYCGHTTGQLEKVPTLNFIGPISDETAPFQYAMDPSKNINYGDQLLTYITYYSGWPTNLKVQYDPDTDKNTLMDYPTFAELSSLTNLDEAKKTYPYITKDNLDAANRAYQKYLGSYVPKPEEIPGDSKELTQNERDILNAVFSIVLPTGIEAIGTVTEGETEKGLFEAKEAKENSTVDKTITAYGLTEVADGAFAGCKNVTSIVLSGDTKSIGAHVFDGCEKLTSVSIPASVSSLGNSPFRGCKNLANVNFNGGPYFVCENSLIFELDEDGVKTKLVEYLNGKVPTSVSAEELTGILEIYPEAFMGADVGRVDLSGSLIDFVPESAFQNTSVLYEVILPNTCDSIGKNAFANSRVQFIKVPSSVQFIDGDAFTDTNLGNLTFNCEEGSYADTVGKRLGIKTSYYYVPKICKVTFVDKGPDTTEYNELGTVEVEAGEGVPPYLVPEVPEREGFTHIGWSDDLDVITYDLITSAVWEKDDETYYTITYVNDDGTYYDSQLVKKGSDVKFHPADPTKEGYTFQGWVLFKPGSPDTGSAPVWENIQEDMTVMAVYVLSNITYWNVTFRDYDYSIIGETQVVQEGWAAKPPEDPVREGYVFSGWLPTDYLEVYKDLDIVAQYIQESEVTYTITYWYDYANIYMTQKVKAGDDAFVPNDPVKEGYKFQGWIIFGGEHSGETPVWTNIQDDLTVIADFVPDSGSESPGESESPAPGSSESPGPGTSSDPGTSSSPNPGTSSSPSPGTSNSPSPGTSSSPDPGTSGSPAPGASSSPGTGSTLYTLTVQNGSGSGSYVEGAQPIIIANDPASGQVFDYWSVSPDDVKIASIVLSASIITMPAKDVTVTAHYKAATGSTTSSNTTSSNTSGSGGTTGSGNSSQRPSSGSNTVTNGNTTVVIDKNGLSNTGVVSATVNGSSDNFTIKITESNAATEAALRALMAEYGTLDNIKYFPMDISLYDSTGTNKITDTTGISVTITLPLPDSLVTYAGNNRAASVVNNSLERLSARFATIQGVSCITFTAEHFSPYVIYVNTGDLSSGEVSDSTPKTGDFIHPKWFLSIALACMSFVLFMQKDVRKPKKVKVKAKAR